MQTVSRKKNLSPLPQFDVPPWQALQEKILELFQMIIDDERKHLPKSTVREAKLKKKKMLEEKWMMLESIRKKVNSLVEQEINRLEESEGKPN